MASKKPDPITELLAEMGFEYLGRTDRSYFGGRYVFYPLYKALGHGKYIHATTEDELVERAMEIAFDDNAKPYDPKDNLRADLEMEC